MFSFVLNIEYIKRRIYCFNVGKIFLGFKELNLIVCISSSKRKVYEELGRYLVRVKLK